MKIAWVAPDDHNASITEYEIQIDTLASGFTTTSECDGSNSDIVN